jgi:four helix bundle protein
LWRLNIQTAGWGWGRGWGAGGRVQGWRCPLGYGLAPSGLLGWGMRLEHMRMYRAAEELAAEVDRLLPRARRRARRQANHLARSADSVLLNTAEGIGSFKPGVKLSAYDIARKEATEVRAVLRRMVIARVFTSAETSRAQALANTCIAMLTRAAIAIEDRTR